MPKRAVFSSPVSSMDTMLPSLLTVQLVSCYVSLPTLSFTSLHTIYSLIYTTII